MRDYVAPYCSLKELGYRFNEKGELRSLGDDQPFKFTSQEAYERVGDAVTHEIYSLMEKVGLQRIPMKKPQDTDSDDHFSFVFASPDYNLKHTVMVLIHGMGAVRAGQWSRKLIMNENLDNGSMLPYIERALSNGWGVVVTNTNLTQHYFPDCEAPQLLRYSKSNEHHMQSFWYRFMKWTKARQIYVVAHGRGGQDINFVLDTTEWERRVACICLTDAWFEFREDRDQQPFVINWSARDKSSVHRPTRPNFHRNIHKVYQVWAGTSEHERAPSSAYYSIFHVLETGVHEGNIDNLLQEAWDLMEPPLLEAEIDVRPRIIETDADGNLKVNEELFKVEGIINPDHNNVDEDGELSADVEAEDPTPCGASDNEEVNSHGFGRDDAQEREENREIEDGQAQSAEDGESQEPSSKMPRLQ